ncbi:MAG: XRE family transcriptional regulator [Tannerellaceae bacterium]|jgi:transcriptional regulator with XRE-family HTH domain|nr:XRE family transcriptional regulator [Tannerellaceae bacterium]
MKNDKKLGKKITAIRETKRMSIRDVSERTGLCVEQIERIETGIEFPSMAPLIKIARTLGVRLGTFLDDQENIGPIVRRCTDAVTGFEFSNDEVQGRHHMTYHSLANDKSGRHMEPFLIEVSPSSEDDLFRLSSHEGEEFIYVIEGSVEINYGTTTYLLKAGDSIYYDSIVTHHVHAADDRIARILGVIYTPF